MTDLAVLSDGDTALQLKNLQNALEWVRTAGSPDDVADMAEKARLGREFARLTKMAAELRQAALLLELASLRRLGQLGASHLVESHRLAQAAEWLASLDEEVFIALPSTFPNCGTPIGFNVAWNRRAERDRLANVGFGVPDTPTKAEVALSRKESLIEAAHVILDRVQSKADAFSISEVADELAEEISSYRANDAEGEAIRRGLREVVRESLNYEEATPTEDDELWHPLFVTYYEGALGWVRVAWKNASLEQLQFMASYRRKQADEMAAAAEQLESLVAALEDVRESGEVGTMGPTTKVAWLQGLRIRRSR